MTATASRSGGPSPAARTMRGREHEWGVVLGLLKAAESGRPGVLLVEGEPGTGKSLLHEEAVRAAIVHGLTPATSRAHELGGLTPAEPLLSALGEPSPVRESLLMDALRSNLEKRAGAGPVLVSLDDLHCADPATLAALQALCGHLDCHPVAWLLSRRTTERGDTAARLFEGLERDGAERCPLGPLGDDALAETAIDILGAKPDPGLVALAAGAGGNPFLLTELLAGLRDEGAVRISGGRARLSSARLPERARTGVGRRLDGLSPRTRHLLTVSAVLGRSFSPEDVAEILGTTPAALVPGLDEALASGILQSASDALRFRHDLVRRVIVEGVPAPVRQALHRQVGEVLIGREGATASAASHLVQGVRAGDVRALARLDQVVAAVLPRSPQSAADLAVHALELTGFAEPDRAPRTLTAVRTLIATGRLDEAARLARDAFARPMPALPCARLHCLLSEILHLRGRADEAAEEASAALAEPCLSDGLRDDAELALLNARAGAGGEVLERAAAIVCSTGEHGDALISGAFLTLALAEWDAGALTTGLALAEEAVRRARSADARGTHPRLVLAMLLTDVQRPAAARTVLASAGDVSPDHLAWTAAPAILSARAHLAAGRFHDAAAEAEEGLAATGGLGPHLLMSSGLAALAAATLRAGDVNAAHRYAHGADRRPSVSLALVTAQVTEAREGAAALEGFFPPLCAQVLRHRWTLIADPAAAAWLVRTAHSLGDRPSGEAVVAAVELLAADNPAFPAARAAAAHARGLLDGSASSLEQAVTGHTGPWARASAMEDLAVLVTPASRRRAVAAFDTALSAYEAMDATRDAARVRRRLRRLGVRRRHWSRIERPVSGWASLTDTERAVSELVAQSLTNRQVADQLFMSEHTVAFHLRHVFRKLNIGSRVELARLAFQRNI
ncbi:LuxR C-terminal-related transcriptional regulator [Actinomadura sp. DC4]|uniref:ATP-binding protein n=1 Tax=Actinomadura sp. DC4 TaxID=3055069 RepID=UPI0025B19744|nr:LuxR C-terminal-related transcriptional regulator [Actinomadura sp. DC4]MDN3354664.1 LuxR C-terminal-related transcriptional regulator [Actinomadura sp. DC4]